MFEAEHDVTLLGKSLLPLFRSQTQSACSNNQGTGSEKSKSQYLGWGKFRGWIERNMCMPLYAHSIHMHSVLMGLYMSCKQDLVCPALSTQGPVYA